MKIGAASVVRLGFDHAEGCSRRRSLPQAGSEPPSPSLPRDDDRGVVDVECPDCGSLDTDIPFDNETTDECKTCGHRWDRVIPVA